MMKYLSYALSIVIDAIMESVLGLVIKPIVAGGLALVKTGAVFAGSLL